jgi:hypothetical protein
MVIDSQPRPSRTIRVRLTLALIGGGALLLALIGQLAGAQGQGHEHEHEHPVAVPAAAPTAAPTTSRPTSTAAPASSLEANAKRHMLMTPAIRATSADSGRAAKVAGTLRGAIAKYRDTSAAVADGYRMFLPNVKEQRVYHFTNRWRAVQEAFRFDPAKPTSLLYQRGADGKLVLIGAMYTAPKRFSFEQLDARVPLSIARWHEHVNWCVPKRGETKRWLERRDGDPLFGPESRIATREGCDAVGGRFHETLFGWMLHANVFDGDSPATIWGDDHAGHDGHAMMQMDQPM